MQIIIVVKQILNNSSYFFKKYEWIKQLKCEDFIYQPRHENWTQQAFITFCVVRKIS